MDGKDEDNADKLVCVPDKGYFYFESAGDNKEDRYYVVMDNGKYLIEHGDWVFEKVEYESMGFADLVNPLFFDLTL